MKQLLRHATGENYIRSIKIWQTDGAVEYKGTEYCIEVLETGLVITDLSNLKNMTIFSYSNILNIQLELC